MTRPTLLDAAAHTASRRGARRTAPPAGGAPQRRCLASGEVMATGRMVRFVVGPDGQVVPDITGRLPGRGLWLRADRDMVNTAVTRRLFARAARQPVAVSPDLAGDVEAALTRRTREIIGLARRAGEAIAGRDKVRDRLRAGAGGVLLMAADGSVDERKRTRALAADMPVVEVFSAAELGGLFGRDHTVHALVLPGGLARRLTDECRRLGGFRAGVTNGGAEVQSDETLDCE